MVTCSDDRNHDAAETRADINDRVGRLEFGAPDDDVNAAADEPLQHRKTRKKANVRSISTKAYW
jgi:hypothetical protein